MREQMTTKARTPKKHETNEQSSLNASFAVIQYCTASVQISISIRNQNDIEPNKMKRYNCHTMSQKHRHRDKTFQID